MLADFQTSTILRVWMSTVAIVLGCQLTLPVFGVEYRFVQKLEKPNGQRGDRFGESIAVVNGIIAIGARDDDSAAENAGAVYLYDRTGAYIRQIVSPSPEREGLFGENMHAVGDDKLAISAVGENDRVGRAYVFDLSGNLVHTIENPSPDQGDEFGRRTVIANESHILVSGYRDQSYGANDGAVYLFDHQGNLETIFTSPRPETDGFFGRAAAFVDADGIVITDHGDNTGGEDAGIAYLFDLEGNLVETLENPHPDFLDVFGTAAAYADNRILIGADQDINLSGAVHIFDVQGRLLATTPDPEPAPLNWFGWSAISVRNGFLVSSIFNDDLGQGGEAYLLDVEGNILHTFENPEPGAKQHFGVSFGVVDDQILIGSNFGGSGFPSGAGAVYVFAPVLAGDFNENGLFDVDDLELLCYAALRRRPRHRDITGDGWVTGEDVTKFLELAGSLPGDADLDGTVTFQDFLALADGFGQPGNWSAGDFNCNREVEFGDFLIVSSNFGQSAVAIASVPEPTLGVILFSLVLVHALARLHKGRGIPDSREQRDLRG